MRRQMLKTLVLCCCLAWCVGAAISARAQGHPPPPPGGGRMPPPPPGGGAPASGGGSTGSTGSGPGAPPASVMTRTGIKLGPPGRWWDEKGYAQQVGLSKDQQKKMDAIFDKNRDAIVGSYKTLLKDKAAVDAMSKDANVDKAKLFAAIDAANEAHAALEKANTQMLLEIREQLDAGQVAKLEKMP